LDDCNTTNAAKNPETSLLACASIFLCYTTSKCNEKRSKDSPELNQASELTTKQTGCGTHLNSVCTNRNIKGPRRAKGSRYASARSVWSTTRVETFPFECEFAGLVSQFSN
jgi:hypothetical protein